MPPAQLHLIGPDEVADFLSKGAVRQALDDLAALAGAELTVAEPIPEQSPSKVQDVFPSVIPITYRGKTYGNVSYRPNGSTEPVATAARAIARLIEHMLDRELAVGDLAEAMFTCYEELNMLYALLPKVASKAYPRDIAEVLVDETARTLNCGRVSLLILDENEENLRVLASRGLPDEARDVQIPVGSSVAGRALLEDDLLAVNDVADRPDLQAMSGRTYESAAFTVIRVPLRARGEAVGVLTATDRRPLPEFTARDRKLMDGLSAMGASALMNCRLHAAVTNQMLSTIQALASAVDAKDQYTHEHSGRVAQLCVATARQLGETDPATLREVELSGLLHDIGKIGIPDAILSKKAHLTTEEFAVAKTHVHIGASIVEHVRGLESVAKAILHHHERHDGMGYPSGLTADVIPFASKLIAVTDVFDTLTSDRPYRKATSVQSAVQELRRSSGTHLDPAIVDAFLDVIKGETPQHLNGIAQTQTRTGTAIATGS